MAATCKFLLGTSMGRNESKTGTLLVDTAQYILKRTYSNLRASLVHLCHLLRLNLISRLQKPTVACVYSCVACWYAQFTRTRSTWVLFTWHWQFDSFAVAVSDAKLIGGMLAHLVFSCKTCFRLVLFVCSRKPSCDLLCCTRMHVANTAHEEEWIIIYLRRC